MNEAEGDAAKFLATWEAYTKAKDVTRKRLYLETLQRVVPKVGRVYIMDSEGRGALPLLNLNKNGVMNQ